MTWPDYYANLCPHGMDANHCPTCAPAVPDAVKGFAVAVVLVCALAVLAAWALDREAASERARDSERIDAAAQSGAWDVR